MTHKIGTDVSSNDGQVIKVFRLMKLGDRYTIEIPRKIANRTEHDKPEEKREISCKGRHLASNDCGLRSTRNQETNQQAREIPCQSKAKNQSSERWGGDGGGEEKISLLHPTVSYRFSWLRPLSPTISMTSLPLSKGLERWRAPISGVVGGRSIKPVGEPRNRLSGNKIS